LNKKLREQKQQCNELESENEQLRQKTKRQQIEFDKKLQEMFQQREIIET